MVSESITVRVSLDKSVDTLALPSLPRQNQRRLCLPVLSLAEVVALNEDMGARKANVVHNKNECSEQPKVPRLLPELPEKERGKREKESKV
jgi:hypothetical protein